VPLSLWYCTSRRASLPPHDRDFHAKNPTIAAFDGGKRGATVAAAFVERQLESMRAGDSKQQAYDVALAWMLDNGPAMAARLDLPKDARAVLELRPEDVPAARAAAKAEMEEELEHVRRVLASTEEEEEEGQGGEVVDRAGLFLSPQLQLGIGLRGLSAEAAVDSRIVDAAELAGHSSAGKGAAAVQVDVLESKGSAEEAVSRVLAGGGAAAPKPTKER
jgi:hypothetical protein